MGIKGEPNQMNHTQDSDQTVDGKLTIKMKRTLNLTSLLMNAMTLIAPGALLWTTFQVQAAQMNGGVTTATEMWPGLVAAIILSLLTAISYAELSNIYPKAGNSPSVGTNCQVSNRLDITPLLLDLSRNNGSIFS